MKGGLHNPDHPIYSLARFIVVMASVLGALWITATEFDETEWKAAGGIAMAVAAVFGSEFKIREFIKRGQNEKDDAETTT